MWKTLNNEATAVARPGVGRGKGFGHLLDLLITAVNRVSNQVAGVSAGVAIATTASKVKTAVAVQYLNDDVTTSSKVKRAAPRHPRRSASACTRSPRS
jgi:hypothetical protein